MSPQYTSYLFLLFGGMLICSGVATAQDEQKVYDLINANKYQDAVDIINSMHPVPWEMQAQKFYLLLDLNQVPEAALCLGKMVPTAAQMDEYKLLRANLEERNKDYAKAYTDYHDLESSKDSEIAKESAAQLAYLPDYVRTDKWLWGDLEGEGSYEGRFGLVSGDVDLKVGTYIPGARWIQPYFKFSYIGDSRSSASTSIDGLGSIYSENLAGPMVGMQLKPFNSLDITIYAEGGAFRDLITSPAHRGLWFAAVQGGIRGYESWGPGAVLNSTTTPIQLRMDWYTDFGGDFSYYTRIPDGIAYLQGHEGFRALQFGSLGALDMYIAENSSFDIRESYYDNFIDAGPGMRLILQPTSNMTISLDGSYSGGAYLGVNGLHDRNRHDPTYDGPQVTASISLQW